MNSNIRKSVAKSSLDALEASSAQFLLKPISTRHFFIRVLWSLFILTSVATCCYYITLNVMDYLQFDKITSIYTVYEDNSQFPTVSVCSVNSVKLNSSFTVKQLKFNNHDYRKDWKNHMEEYIDPYFGVCYRFNSGKNATGHKIGIKYSTMGGKDYGLRMNFFSKKLDNDVGHMAVLIHNHSMIPYSIYPKAQYISAGNINYFKIKRTLDVKLELPYNKCYTNVSLFPFNQTVINYIKKKQNRVYRQADCINLCLSLLFIERNNIKECNEDHLDEVWFEYKVMLNLTNCTKQIIDFPDFETGNELEICAKYCPLKCDSFNIDVFDSVLPINNFGNFTRKVYAKFEDFEVDFRHDYAIRVFYEELKYTLITQKPKLEFFGLLSNCGGLFGFFLGLSFVSLIEIVEILLEAIWSFRNLFRSRINRNQSDN